MRLRSPGPLAGRTFTLCRGGRSGTTRREGAQPLHRRVLLRVTPSGWRRLLGRFDRRPGEPVSDDRGGIEHVFRVAHSKDNHVPTVTSDHYIPVIIHATPQGTSSLLSGCCASTDSHRCSDRHRRRRANPARRVRPTTDRWSEYRRRVGEHRCAHRHRRASLPNLMERNRTELQQLSAGTYSVNSPLRHERA